jgi:hypothetical protein
MTEKNELPTTTNAADALASALENCLHEIGNCWTRFGVPVERWDELKKFTGEGGYFPKDWNDTDRRWWHAYRTYRDGAGALAAFDPKYERPSR